MSRAGQNPMRWIKGVHHPERITFTTIVHIPNMDGYWAQSLDVLKLCFQSLIKNTQMPFDLMVFDNASCAQVQEYLLELRRKGTIQYLILSEHNMGKSGAWNILLQAAPGEIVSYADSDIYFLPGWLEASLKIMEAYPKTGMVTAQAMPGDHTGDELTLDGIQKDPSISIKEGKDLIPKEQIEARGKSLGEPPEVYGCNENRRDVLVSRGAVSAYVGASVFQFTTTKKILKTVFPIETEMPMMDDIYDVNKIGYWRLSTTEYLVHHMGNMVPDLQDELKWLKIEDITHAETPKQKFFPSSRLLQNFFIRSILKRLNAFTYKLLYNK